MDIKEFVKKLYKCEKLKKFALENKDKKYVILANESSKNFKVKLSDKPEQPLQFRIIFECIAPNRDNNLKLIKEILEARELRAQRKAFTISNNSSPVDLVQSVQELDKLKNELAFKTIMLNKIVEKNNSSPKIIENYPITETEKAIDKEIDKSILTPVRVNDKLLYKQNDVLKEATLKIIETIEGNSITILCFNEVHIPKDEKPITQENYKFVKRNTELDFDFDVDTE